MTDEALSHDQWQDGQISARERETIFSQMLERTSEGLVLIQDERFVYLNARFAEMLGYRVADLLGKPILDFIHPQDRAMVVSRYQQRMAGMPVPQSYECSLLHSNGQRLAVELNAAIVDFRGRAADFVFLRDVSEHKRARKQVQRLLDQQMILNRLALSLGQLARLEQIYETFAELICELLPVDLLFISFYDAPEQLIRAEFAYGYGHKMSTADLPALPLASEGRGLQSQVIRTGSPIYIPDYLEAFHHHQTVYEVRPDGSVTPDIKPSQVEDPVRSIFYTPMKISGQTIAVLQIQSYIKDAFSAEDTELVSALANMAAIAIQNARLLAQTREQALQVQQIINSVPDGVVLLDSSFVVVLANPAAQAYLAALNGPQVGEKIEQLGERPLTDLLSPPPSGLWHQVAVQNAAYEIISRPFEAGLATSGWVLVIHDSTKELEIQQRVQQQERLASVGQLAAGIAHDFNNIMTIISLYVDLVQLSENALTRNGRTRLHLVAQQANRAAELIQQILDFSRCAVLERRPLDLLPFLKEVLKLLERTLMESINIEIVYQPGQFMVSADPTRMQQMIVNLALNARDAMPNGGRLLFDLATITVDDAQSAPLADMLPGSWVKLAVFDNGVGISPEILPHIFDPFFTTKDAGKGAGLGLAQVWGIVQQHEGHIHVTSQAGVGTTFTIFLPFHAPLAAKAVDEGDAGLNYGHQEMILVAEDNPVTRQALVDSLLMMNFQVMTARNGREALQIIEMNPGKISLIISDIVMPEMGGITLIREVRAQKLSVRFLLLSGHTHPHELEQFQSDPTVQWLAKPVSLEQLASSVTAILAENAA